MPTGAHSGSCFAAFVVNAWTTPVTLGATFDAQTLDLSNSAFLPQGSGSSLTYTPLESGLLQPNQVAIVFLAHFDAPTSTVQNGPQTNTALPTSVWDTNYIGATAYQGEVDGSNMNKMDGNLVFVAAQDGTTITINPVVAVAGNVGVAAASEGVPQTYTLDQGETLQIEQFGDLTGSPVLADKPIGMWGGHYAMFVPDPSTRAADAAHQQIPPIKALGSEYVAVRYRERVPESNESVPWRLVGAVNGTTLSYEPGAPAGAPTALGQGQVAEFQSPGPFVVESQDSAHPFYMTAYMTGGGDADGLGDPEAVNIVPPQHFLDHYVFFTDPTRRQTSSLSATARVAVT